MHKFDYLIIGCGLYAALFAYKAIKAGRKVLIIDKRSHIGGNLYCENVNGITVHSYGAHIFHTSRRDVWDFVNSFVEFTPFVNSPVANYSGELYNLPFSMNTFYQLWEITEPGEAQKIIKEQISQYKIDDPRNLEEQALRLVGRDIYEKLIKGYTEKQWGRPATELPAFIIKRLPLRFTFDNNYFNDTYQGIPRGGYNRLIESLIEGAELRLNTDFTTLKNSWRGIADKLIYTGQIDEFFDYRLGQLEYRSLRFEHQAKKCNNYQGVAVMNFTDHETPYTRIIEHRHFDRFCEASGTIITKEYPQPFDSLNNEPYYPVNDQRNNELYEKYMLLANELPDVTFGGRLGEYKYFNMDQIVEKIMGMKI